MILTASVAKAAAWSYDCPFIQQFRVDISYKLFRQQAEIASKFESGKHQLDDLIKAFESWNHRFRLTILSSEISLELTWKNNNQEGKTNSQSRGLKEGLRVYFLSFQCGLQQ